MILDAKASITVEKGAWTLIGQCCTLLKEIPGPWYRIRVSSFVFGTLQGKVAPGS